MCRLLVLLLLLWGWLRLRLRLQRGGWQRLHLHPRPNQLLGRLAGCTHRALALDRRADRRLNVKHITRGQQRPGPLLLLLLMLVLGGRLGHWLPARIAQRLWLLLLLLVLGRGAASRHLS